MYRFKKIFLCFLLIVLSLIIVELFGHSFYYFKKGTFLWRVNNAGLVFNVRPFTEPVNDDRFVTNKKDFTYVMNEENYAWEVRIDSNRFRIGGNKYFTDKDNIVFLGDSVPFGWGIAGSKSIPSIFFDLLQKNHITEYGVINAAIPSYSLYQSIQRYEYEINEKFPVKYVILQIYDPVSQFLIWGRDWNRNICWTSNDTFIPAKAIFEYYSKKKTFFISLMYRYSSIYHLACLIKIRLDKIKKLNPSLGLNDEYAFTLFEEENIDTLRSFYALLKKKNIKLIILSTNPTRPYSTNKFMHAGYIVHRLNKILQNFASSYEDVYFFDVNSYFNKIGRNGLFIDEACHLSHAGTQKEAEFIFEGLRSRDLL